MSDEPPLSRWDSLKTHKTTIAAIFSFFGGLFLGVVANVAFFQHNVPMSPYFSDYDVNIVQVSIDDRVILITVNNKWDNEASINTMVETEPKINISYVSKCVSSPCTQLTDNIISIPAHESRTLNISFNTHELNGTLNFCVKASSLKNGYLPQYGRDCKNITIT